MLDEFSLTLLHPQGIQDLGSAAPSPHDRAPPADPAVSAPQVSSVRGSIRQLIDESTGEKKRNFVETVSPPASTTGRRCSFFLSLARSSSRSASRTTTPSVTSVSREPSSESRFARSRCGPAAEKHTKRRADSGSGRADDWLASARRQYRTDALVVRGLWAVLEKTGCVGDRRPFDGRLGRSCAATRGVPRPGR